jgi:hypothetical protein
MVNQTICQVHKGEIIIPVDIIKEIEKEFVVHYEKTIEGRLFGE